LPSAFQSALRAIRHVFNDSPTIILKKIRRALGPFLRLFLGWTWRDCVPQRRYLRYFTAALAVAIQHQEKMRVQEIVSAARAFVHSPILRAQKETRLIAGYPRPSHLLWRGVAPQQFALLFRPYICIILKII
jgi:hypothetical protein